MHQGGRLVGANNFPRLHNAMWPGLVGKGPDSEPPIALDAMLEMTANARVDGVGFDGVDLFLADPHTSIDSTADDIKRLADKIGGHGLAVGSLVAPVWPPVGGGSAMGSAEERKRFVTMVEKACRIGRQLREIGIRPSGVVRIDFGGGRRRMGCRSRRATRRRSPKRSSRPARSPRTLANGSRRKARSAGAACTAGNIWSQLLEMVGKPEDARVSGRHGAHAALHARLQCAGASPASRGLRLEGRRDIRRGAARPSPTRCVPGRSISTSLRTTPR